MPWQGVAMTALEHIRSQRGLAFRIAREIGVHPSTVSQWTQVPAHHAREVARITGLSLTVLRPDLWSEKEQPE
jgi:DNA-binding transcriptional regulator YdaS (Cro superfamily)